MRVVGEVGAPPKKNPCLGFALGPSLNPVVRSHGLHGTTPPYIYGPSRAKTKWNGSWTGWFIIFRPNSHENIGHFEPDPKNGMLPSHISLDFPRNYGPVHGGHPSPYIFRFPRLGIVMRGSCIMTLGSGRGVGGA